MHSLRSKTTLLTVGAIAVAMVVVTLVATLSIRGIGKADSNQLLSLLCEAGEKNLDYYFDSVEQSVQMVSAFVDSDLEGLAPDQLEGHLERTKEVFAKLTQRTNGVLTYYYRLDPEVTTAAEGFWFVNLNGQGFKEHKVTDITLYDTDDTTQLVWFTVPKETGEPVWLPPYITDNLGVRVVSYNVPVYWRGRFIGVIGIEVNYNTVAEVVKSISLYDGGYAFLTDDTGKLIYHPIMDVPSLDELPETPAGLVSDDPRVSYAYGGVEKDAVWRRLGNDMRLYVSVPASEIDANWMRHVGRTALVFVVLLLALEFGAVYLTRRITHPLQELTETAELVNKGDYECDIPSEGDDEVRTIGSAIKKLIVHLGVYVKDLNNQAYVDPLTSVRNIDAYDAYLRDVQVWLQSQASPEFGICIFDCNNLKQLNEQAGRDKGDLYLKSTCSIICDVFDRSPVFRLGGDEFGVILRDTDYAERNRLLRLFDDICAARREHAQNAWERIDVARGLAVFDPDLDETVSDVARRADKLMYENKWQRYKTHE